MFLSLLDFGFVVVFSNLLPCFMLGLVVCLFVCFVVGGFRFALAVLLLCFALTVQATVLSKKVHSQ